MFGESTHHLSVSIAKPGPIMPFHQPSVGCDFDAGPVACESPVRACSTRTALLLSAFGSPQVSNAILAEASSRPFSSFRFVIGANWRSPEGSPSRQAPVAGGRPISWRLSSSVMKAEATESSELWNSIDGNSLATQSSCVMVGNLSARLAQVVKCHCG